MRCSLPVYNPQSAMCGLATAFLRTGLLTRNRDRGLTTLPHQQGVYRCCGSSLRLRSLYRFQVHYPRTERAAPPVGSVRCTEGLTRPLPGLGATSLAYGYGSAPFLCWV